MRIALIAEHFPPLRSSCAVQMRDLALELRDMGHQVTFLTPSAQISARWEIEDFAGIRLVRLKAFETRDRSYAVRMLGELAMPLLMLRNFRASPLGNETFDGIAWYSPHIFFGPLVAALKKQSDCPAYLILRDIFPEWAADVGVMRRGPAYRFLQQIARYQYRVADVIGVQTPANQSFFEKAVARGKRVQVLQNWMREPVVGSCSIDLSVGPLSGRRIFVYAGNMGVAQGMDRLLDLAESLRDDASIGFAFVGRGSDAARLEKSAASLNLTNIAFHSEIPPEEIPGLYAQADAGLVALDPRHRWHNIPGKFISYMHAGLPVLALVNQGNDLIELIRTRDVGRVTTRAGSGELPSRACELMGAIGPEMQARCRKLAADIFSAAAAARQLSEALSLANDSASASRRETL